MSGGFKTRNSKRHLRGSALFGPLIIAAALFGAALLFDARTPEPEVIRSAPIVSAYDMVEIPVPIEVVPAGTKVRDMRVRSLQFPRHQLPQGAVTDLSALIDSQTLVPIPADLPLMSDNFTREGGVSNAVVDRIPPGMRAITVKVDVTSSVEGWAGSGSIVDVLLVGRERTSVIAEQVKILSAERTVVPVGGSVAPTVPSTVTLLVSQEQCLAISTALPLGRLAFALRSTRDDARWRTTDFSPNELRGQTETVGTQGSSVRGYISFSEAPGRKRSFALSSGRWIETAIVPDGFRLSRNGAQGAGTALAAERGL
jgi:pilus assembly protein CpaB